MALSLTHSRHSHKCPGKGEMLDDTKIIGISGEMERQERKEESRRQNVTLGEYCCLSH